MERSPTLSVAEALVIDAIRKMPWGRLTVSLKNGKVVHIERAESIQIQEGDLTAGN